MTTIRGLMRGLSDYWTVFFKERDQLVEMYKAADVLAGQAYLDLMSVVLTSSLRDTPVFNKKYFQHIRVQEDEILFKEGPTSDTDFYVYPFEDQLVTAPFLNNKIFDATEALERGIDYFVADRTVQFFHDPTNAYTSLTLGQADSAFFVRSRQENIVPSIFLDDQLGQPLTATRSDASVHVVFDSTVHTSKQIVQVINVTKNVNELLLASLVDGATGEIAPAGTSGFLPLLVTDNNPLEGYASRNITQQFSQKFADSLRTLWAQNGVRKGDLLTDLSTGLQDTIRLTRTDALYLSNRILPEQSSFPYAIVREVSDPTIKNEQFPSIGTVFQAGIDGEFNPATGTFSSPTAAFHIGFVGEYIRIDSEDLNLPILDVVSATEVRVGTTFSTPLAGVTWQHYSVTSVTNDTIPGLGALIGTNQFVSPGPVFTPTDVGKVLSINQGPIQSADTLIRFTIASVETPTEVTLTTDHGSPGPVFWFSLARVLPPQYSLAFGAPNGLVKQGSTAINARRFVDNDQPVEGRDYTVSPNTGTITPITVWVPTRMGTVTYDYQKLVVDNLTPVNNLGTGSVTAATTTFQVSPGEYEFTAADIGRSFVIVDSAENNGTYEIASVTDTETVDVTVPFSATPDVKNGIIQWRFTNGALALVGDDLQFTEPTFRFTQSHVGAVIQLLNSGNSNIEYLIESVVSDTTVVVTAPITPTLPVPNDGVLNWQLLRRGTITEDAQETRQVVSEISFWGEDVLVDRELLYNNYGYLINRYQPSSQAYKDLIRGIFQLFMLGPSLERMESAINVVAGLPVIRDDNEILIGYDDGVLQSGNDATLDATAYTFASPSAAFTPADVGGFIDVLSGFNSGKTFQIQNVVDANTVTIGEQPVIDGPMVEWQFRKVNEQTVTTTRTTYTFPSTIRLKEFVTDPANVGVYTFRAFEVLSDVFEVTDWVETPTWWDTSTVPEEIWPNQDINRRTSSPTLFENVINPADNAQIGDPGFFIGADSQGNTIPDTVILDPALNNGEIEPDPTYPFSTTETFFNATGLLPEFVGSYVEVDQGTFRITEFISNTRVRIEAFTPLTAATGLEWRIIARPLPKRYKAAFVIFDSVLKKHMFSVRFDSSIISQVSSTLITDLNELVLTARPSYTYVVVTPATLFQEALGLQEDDIDVSPILSLGGSGGAPIVTQDNTFLIGDDELQIGGYFRYYSNTDAAVPTPVVSHTPAAGVPAGHKLLIASVETDPPIPAMSLFTRDVAGFFWGGAAGITTDLGDGVVEFNTNLFIFPTFFDRYQSQYVRLNGTDLYRIIEIVDLQTCRLYAPGQGNAAGVQWRVVTAGSNLGSVYVDDEGQSFFRDELEAHTFQDKGTYIRRPYPVNAARSQYRVAEVPPFSIYTARIGEVIDSDYTFDVEVTGGGTTITVLNNDFIVKESMCYQDRRALDPSTAKQVRYRIVPVGQPESGPGGDPQNSAFFDQYISPSVFRYENAGFPGVGVHTVRVVRDVHYTDLPTEISSWDSVVPSYSLDGDTINFSASTPQPAGSMDITVHGVTVPIDAVATPADPTQGDTPVAVGMQDPYYQNQELTPKGTEMRAHESPVQITRT